MTDADSWIVPYLVMLVQARHDDLTRTAWGVEMREYDWPAWREVRRPAFRCWVCDEIVPDLRAHRGAHRDVAARLRDEDLVPLTSSMRSNLRYADLGFDDAVKVGDVWCMPRALATLLVSVVDYKLMRWAFNRVWFDPTFGEAVIAAYQIPNGVQTLVWQQYQEDA